MTSSVANERRPEATGQQKKNKQTNKQKNEIAFDGETRNRIRNTRKKNRSGGDRVMIEFLFGDVMVCRRRLLRLLSTPTSVIFISFWWRTPTEFFGGPPPRRRPSIALGTAPVVYYYSAAGTRSPLKNGSKVLFFCLERVEKKDKVRFIDAGSLQVEPQKNGVFVSFWFKSRRLRPKNSNRQPDFFVIFNLY